MLAPLHIVEVPEMEGVFSKQQEQKVTVEATVPELASIFIVPEGGVASQISA